MKKIWLIVACVVVAGFLVLALMPNDKKNGVVSNDAYKFYYYPKLNAYYDFQDGNFVYTIDGGDNWLKKKPKNAKLPEKLSKKVMISGPVPDIWRYNDEHREAHNGVNTNYLSNSDPKKDRNSEQEGDDVVKEASAEDEDLKTIIAAPEINEEKPVAVVKEVKVSKKAVQRIPEEEWEADLQVEAERMLNEGKKRVMKEILEVEDSL